MHPSVRKQQYLLRSQHYILKESITDSSSDDDDDENGKASKRLRGKDNLEDQLDEGSNHLPDEIEMPISDTRGEMEVIDITDDVSSDEEEKNTTHITPPAPSTTTTNPIAVNSQRETMAPPVINMSEIVPLRRRATSDLGLGPGLTATSSNLSSNTELGASASYRMSSGIATMTSVASSHASEKEREREKVVAETPERWRNRLWPGKAIIAYCRIITRCRPPDVRVGERMSLSKDSIRAHWRANEMNKIGVFFDNVMMHSSAFFLLTVEESRAAVTNSDDAEQQLALAVDNELSNNNNNNINNTNNNNINNSNTNNTSTINNNTVSGNTINNQNNAAIATSSSDNHNSNSNSNSIGSDRNTINNLPNMFTPSLNPINNNNNNNTNNTNSNSNTTTSSMESMGANGWLDCEIIGIVGTSELGALPQACDPRLGSVWIVSVAIKTPNIHVNADPSSTSSARRGGAGSGRVASSSSSSYLVKESSLSGGDLVVMRGSQWSHAMLGIVQPWDPDYDLKFGANFHAYTSSQHYTRLGDTFYNDNCTDLTTANILICVDSGESAPLPANTSSDASSSGGRGVTSSGLASGEDIGGWAAQGAIHPGVTFSMAIVGNVLTYIRECQALMSLKLLNPALRDAVLKPYQPPPPPPPQSFEGRERSGSVSGVVVGGLSCPRNLPHRLWARLADDFNESQLSAIHEVCRREAATSASASVCLLQGPPGSGKTKTILGILSALLAGALRPPQRTVKVIAGSSFRNDSKTLTQQSEILGKRGRSDSVSSDFNFNASSNTSSNHTSANTSSSSHIVVGSSDRPRVLVCAPSNTAVDELVFRILTQGLLDADGYRAEDLNVVRIGTSSFLRSGGSTSATASMSSSSDVYAAPLNEEDANVMRVVERVSLENIVEDRRKALLASDAKKQLGVSFKYSDIRKQILEKADVVCCTLSGAGSQPILEVILRITGYRFDAVVIDEAAQAVEPSSLIPFKYNPQLVVLVGDPCQLPATVFSRTAKDANYAQSLFLRLQKSGHPVTMLCRQYRMHPLIAHYPSIRFYHGKLVTDPSVNALTTHYKPYHDDVSNRFRPFLFHDLLYSREESDNTSSIRNRDEARYILSLYDALTRRYPNHQKNIGIIAPYRAQRRLLMQLFQQRYGLTSLDTEIATVDGFQGREKDVIIFSCTRASQNSNSSNADVIGFLREWQRLNVAITRAKYALWIVGNSRTLQRDSEWSELISYARRQHCLLPFPNEKSTRFPEHVTSNNNHNNHRHHHNNNNNGHKNKSWKKNKDKHKQQQQQQQQQQQHKQSHNNNNNNK